MAIAPTTSPSNQALFLPSELPSDKELQTLSQEASQKIGEEVEASYPTALRAIFSKYCMPVHQLPALDLPDDDSTSLFSVSPNKMTFPVMRSSSHEKPALLLHLKAKHEYRWFEPGLKIWLSSSRVVDTVLTLFRSFDKPDAADDAMKWVFYEDTTVRYVLNQHHHKTLHQTRNALRISLDGYVHSIGPTYEFCPTCPFASLDGKPRINPLLIEDLLRGQFTEVQIALPYVPRELWETLLQEPQKFLELSNIERDAVRKTLQREIFPPISEETRAQLSKILDSDLPDYKKN